MLGVLHLTLESLLRRDSLPAILFLQLELLLKILHLELMGLLLGQEFLSEAGLVGVFHFHLGFKLFVAGLALSEGRF